MASRVIKVVNSEDEVIIRVCQFIQKEANKTFENGQVFKIGVSGGSVAKFLCSGLQKINTDWSKWFIFFCDERCVLFDNDDSTYKYYKENLLSKISIPDSHIININPGVSAEDNAKLYIRKLEEHFPNVICPDFDVLVLGVGPDGHTASLFPGHPLLQEKHSWIAAITDSPKPPPNRITMTLPVLNNAHNVIFISTGHGKAEIVKKILEKGGEDPLPSALVKPIGKLFWFLDAGAASLLSNLN